MLHKGIKNYKLVKKGTVVATIGKEKMIAQQNFYPILFGQSNYEDIFGFLGKKIKQ